MPDGVVQFPLPLSEAETLAMFPPKELEPEPESATEVSLYEQESEQ